MESKNAGACEFLVIIRRDRKAEIDQTLSQHQEPSQNKVRELAILILIHAIEICVNELYFFQNLLAKVEVAAYCTPGREGVREMIDLEVDIHVVDPMANKFGFNRFPTFGIES